MEAAFEFYKQSPLADPSQWIGDSPDLNTFMDTTRVYFENNGVPHTNPNIVVRYFNDNGDLVSQSGPTTVTDQNSNIDLTVFSQRNFFKVDTVCV